METVHASRSVNDGVTQKVTMRNEALIVFLHIEITQRERERKSGVGPKVKTSFPQRITVLFYFWDYCEQNANVCPRDGTCRWKK